MNSLPLLRPRVRAALRVVMTLLRPTWEGVDLRDRSRTQRRGFTSRRNIVAAVPTSRRSCVARRHDAAAANLEGRRSSGSIPYSALEVSPHAVKSLPLRRPRVRAANLEGRRSSRSIPFSVSEVSPLSFSWTSCSSCPLSSIPSTNSLVVRRDSAGGPLLSYRTLRVRVPAVHAGVITGS